jgi:hypothetical protein
MTHSRMYSNAELNRFARFVRGTGLTSSPGAFDALPQGLKRVMNRGGLRMTHFGRGGAFDASVDDDRVMRALKLLAGKLSAEDWAAFREVLAGAEEMSSDEPPPWKGRPETGVRVTGTEDEENVETAEEIEALQRKKNLAVKGYNDRHPGTATDDENLTQAEIRALERNARAMDSKSYAGRFPSAARLGADKYQPAPPSAPAAQPSDYAARFPNAARIGRA